MNNKDEIKIRKERLKKSFSVARNKSMKSNVSQSVIKEFEIEFAYIIDQLDHSNSFTAGKILHEGNTLINDLLEKMKN